MELKRNLEIEQILSKFNSSFFESRQTTWKIGTLGAWIQLNLNYVIQQGANNTWMNGGMGMQQNYDMNGGMGMQQNYGVNYGPQQIPGFGMPTQQPNTGEIF